MLRGGVDIFVFIMHFLNDKCEPCQISIDFFEILHIFRSAMALRVTNIFAKHEFNAYVKYERNNCSTMTFTLMSIVG